MRKSLSRQERIGMIVVLAIPLSITMGCAARLNQFKELSETGVAYSTALVAFTDASGDLAIDADSAVAETVRSGYSRSGRIDYIEEQNRIMAERLTTLADIRQHTMLLKAYFQSMEALAGSTIGTGIAADTKGIVASLGKLNPRIAGATVTSGGAKIGDLVEPVTSLVVKGLQQAALEAELKKNGKTIANELALQEAAVKAMTEIWETDQQILLERQRTQSALKYRNASNLPADWASKRRQALRGGASLSLAQSATDASTRLRESFVALVENRLEADDLPLLVNDIDSIVELIKLVSGDS